MEGGMRGDDLSFENEKDRTICVATIVRRPLVSLMMRSAGDDAIHAVLEIEFVTGQVYTGHVYRYHAASRREWIGLMQAESKNQHFASNIRDKSSTRKTV